MWIDCCFVSPFAVFHSPVVVVARECCWPVARVEKVNAWPRWRNSRLDLLGWLDFPTLGKARPDL